MSAREVLRYLGTKDPNELPWSGDDWSTVLKAMRVLVAVEEQLPPVLTAYDTLTSEAEKNRYNLPVAFLRSLKEIA